MLDNSVLAGEVIRHGAYVCLRAVNGAQALSAVAIPALAEKLGLQNEFARPAAPESIAYLRRVDAIAADIADDGLLHADAVVHVASPKAEAVRDFCDEAKRLIGSRAHVRIVGGVVRPRVYTSGAMNNFAYAHAVTQQPGAAMPNAFIVPLSKTAGWWAKDWMERHTYFLARYDDAGRMTSQGHALAAEAGIPCLLRRTYKYPTEPAPEGSYDFVSYFECADADVRTFHEVCAALRDLARNPEWKFVREGPTWHGRRVETWPALFAA